LINQHFLIIALFNLIIGLYIYFRNPKSHTHFAFGFLCLNFTTWITCLFVLINAKEYQTALLWGRLTFTGGILIPAALLHFVVSFPDRQLSMRRLALVYIPGLLGFILTFTPLVIKDVEFKSWGLAPVIGLFYPFILLYFLVYLVLSVVTIIKKFRGTKGVLRLQSIYLMFGFVILISHILLTNLILPLLGFKSIYAYGPWSTVEMGVIISYAIIRYRLLDIEFVIKRASVYLMLVAIITGFYVFVLILPYKLFGTLGDPSSILLLVISAIILAVTIQPLRNWLDNITDRLFFQKKYDYYLVLERISRELNSVIKREEIFNIVSHSLLYEMHLKNIAIYLKEKAGDSVFVCHKKEGKESERFPDHLEEGNPFLDYLIEEKGILEAAEFRHRYGYLYTDGNIVDPVRAEIQKILDEEFQGGLIVPLVLKKMLIGFMVLGEKKSGDIFTYRDLALLETLSSQMTTALENINLYEQMLRNERLMIIGTMSAGIAHEIRNPLASIKTFVQMVPERFDRPEFRQRFSEIVPAEIERLTNITSNLLNFSKPSSPRLEGITIQEIMERVLGLLNNKLRKKRMVVEKNIGELPEIQVDSQQIIQVFLNIILNAIQASNPESRIWISAEIKNSFRGRVGAFILVTIADEGIGIKRKDLSQIFEPFFTTKTEGTGLGLATCKRIVEAHCGEIFVESEENKGTKFMVLLPMYLTMDALNL